MGYISPAMVVPVYSMAIVDQLDYLWVKCSHAMVVPVYSMAIVDQLDYWWVIFHLLW